MNARASAKINKAENDKLSDGNIRAPQKPYRVDCMKKKNPLSPLSRTLEIDKIRTLVSLAPIGKLL